MARKFSIAHLSTLTTPPQDLVYLAAAAGFDYVSVRPIFGGSAGERNYNLSLPENREIYEQFDIALNETGIKLSDVELFFITDDCDIEKFLPTMEWAQKHGCHNLISSAWTKNKPYALDMYAKLCEVAKPYGLNCNFEFVTWSACPTLREAKEYINYSGADNVGLLVDTLHFDRSRVPLEDLDDCPDKWFNFFHMCDGPSPRTPMDDRKELARIGRTARLYPGEGVVDMASIIRKLPRDTVCSLEIPHIKRVGAYGAMEHVRNCIEHAKKYLAENDLL